LLQKTWSINEEPKQTNKAEKNTKKNFWTDFEQAGKHHDYDFNTHNNEAIKN